MNWTPEQAVGLESPPPRFRNESGKNREHAWTKVKFEKNKTVLDAPQGSFSLYLITNNNDFLCLSIALIQTFYQLLSGSVAISLMVNICYSTNHLA